MRWLVILICLLTVSCAGVRIPFTHTTAPRFLIQTSRKEVNSKCLSLDKFAEAANTLQILHIQQRKNKETFTKEQFLVLLGEECSKRLIQLTTGEIKTELYGDLQSVKDPEILQSLGGMALYYEDVVVHSGIRATLHLERNHSGPKRRLVIIYNLDTNEIVHFNFTGTDNVDEKDLDFPLAEFITEILKNLGKMII